jgi:hypothetical protein
MLSNEGKRQSNDIPDFVRDKPGGCALALWLSYNIPTIYSLKIPEVSRSCYSNNVFCSHLGRTIISWTAIDHTLPTHVACSIIYHILVRHATYRTTPREADTYSHTDIQHLIILSRSLGVLTTGTVFLFYISLEIIKKEHAGLARLPYNMLTILLMLNLIAWLLVIAGSLILK